MLMSPHGWAAGDDSRRRVSREATGDAIATPDIFGRSTIFETYTDGTRPSSPGMNATAFTRRCPRSCAGLEGLSRGRACCHPSWLAPLAPQDDVPTGGAMGMKQLDGLQSPRLAFLALLLGPHDRLPVRRQNESIWKSNRAKSPPVVIAGSERDEAIQFSPDPWIASFSLAMTGPLEIRNKRAGGDVRLRDG